MNPSHIRRAVLFSTLAVAMFATRQCHVGTLPDASWAEFFLAVWMAAVSVCIRRYRDGVASTGDIGDPVARLIDAESEAARGALSVRMQRRRASPPRTR